MHKSGAAKKYLGYERFEILYIQNGIAFTCCAVSFKTIDRFYLKNSQRGGLTVKARGQVKLCTDIEKNPGPSVYVDATKTINAPYCQRNGQQCVAMSLCALIYSKMMI